MILLVINNGNTLITTGLSYLVMIINSFPFLSTLVINVNLNLESWIFMKSSKISKMSSHLRFKQENIIFDIFFVDGQNDEIIQKDALEIPLSRQEKPLSARSSSYYLQGEFTLFIKKSDFTSSQIEKNPHHPPFLVDLYQIH